MDLAISPIVFKHVKRKWEVKIGADAASKELLIHINGVAYDELPEFDDQGIYSSSVENNWKGTVKKTDYVVMDDDQEVQINIRHGEKTRTTKILADGQEHTIKNKTLDDRTLFPWFYRLEERNWDLEVGIDKKQPQFTLKVNERPFNHLQDVNIATENLIEVAEGSSNSLAGYIMFNDV